jgi:Kef-type K+ transport system membrane component KefB
MSQATIFILLGVLFLAGLAADELGHRTHLPRVTLLLAIGLLMGRAGFDLIPPEAQLWFEFLSTAALTMVAFLLGGSMTAANLHAFGREIVLISLSIVVVSFLLVSLGLWLAGVPPALALILGAIACATAPAGTQDAIRQFGGQDGFSEKLKGIVAIGDAWGLLVFSLTIVTAQGLEQTVDLHMLGEAGREIGGAVLLGVVIGLPSAVLTGRLAPGEPLQAEALGLVFLTAGLGLWFNLSFLIAAMVAGAVIVNRARHHRRAFHEIEHIQWPFMILFFLLAGASLEIGHLAQIGLVGVVYVVLRTVARIVGGWLGATLGGSPLQERRWFGPAMLPQAGVAVGMALVAAAEFPEHAETILTLTIGATVVFELVGPFGVMIALRRVAAASSSSHHNI